MVSSEAISLRPHVDHGTQFFSGHSRQGEVVAGREAHHPASSGFRHGREQGFRISRAAGLHFREQRRVIVVEDQKCDCIADCAPTRSRITRTKIAIGVVLQGGRLGGLLDLPEPRPLGSMR